MNKNFTIYFEEIISKIIEDLDQSNLLVLSVFIDHKMMYYVSILLMYDYIGMHIERSTIPSFFY